MASKFHKEILNARNSNDDFELNVEEDQGTSIMKTKGAEKRTSAGRIQANILHGPATNRNFTTLVPQGLPEDLVGEGDETIERQNVLIEPGGYKNEAARLPPFKPFKTVSDEDNIHLLPGQTGERVRQNLLDTKGATKKDVEQVRKAYNKSRKKYPWLYNNKIKPPKEFEDEMEAMRKEKKGLDGDASTYSSNASSSSESETESEEEGSSSGYGGGGGGGGGGMGGMDEWYRCYWNYYFNTMMMCSCGGMPGGYGPCCSPYPPCYQPMRMQPYCCQQKAVGKKKKCGKSKSKKKGKGASGSGSTGSSGSGEPGKDGDSFQEEPDSSESASGYTQGSDSGSRSTSLTTATTSRATNKPTKNRNVRFKYPKPQGLNFDFMPHEDLATEVTMTIEPDDPEPLQYAVENGIMPIICCYMPNSLAVSQQAKSCCCYSNETEEATSTAAYNSGYDSGPGSNPTAYPSATTQSKGSSGSTWGGSAKSAKPT